MQVRGGQLLVPHLFPQCDTHPALQLEELRQNVKSFSKDNQMDRKSLFYPAMNREGWRGR